MVSVEEPAQAWGQTTIRQTARSSQAQRGRRPRDRIGDAGLACCDGGQERRKKEVSVLMGPGCQSEIAHTIQPPSRSMSGSSPC